MIGRIVVMEPAEYEDWLNQGAPHSTLVGAGEGLFRELGCSGCHSPRSTIRAPPLDGLYGKPVALQGGQVIIADENYIRDSILLPNSKITAGYEPVMPTYQARITEEQLIELIAYVKSLGRDRDLDHR
jgi:cytochrome c oxidase subunit 2